MSKILIKNCNLISVDSKRPQVEYNIDILIENNKISNIQKNIKVKADKIIDATNQWVTPGFFNCHTHIPMSLFKEIVDGVKLQDWLTKHIWPLEAKMSKDDIYVFSLLGMLECIDNGVTTINDMYFETGEILKARDETGINYVGGVTMMDVDGADAGEKRIQNNLAFVKSNKGYHAMLVHSFYTTSPKYLQKVIKIGNELKNNLYHVHFCENTQEVNDITKSYNVKHPTQILEKYLKNKKIILAHGVKLDDYDLKALGKLDASISYNPISNMRLGCGFTNLKGLIQNKVNVCLGTDGDGSGSNLSILESMRLACLIPKAVNEDPTLITAYQALQMGTINGAKAIGLEKAKGSITVGKDADINIFKFKNIQMFPINDPVSDIVYNANASDIDTVIINGKIVKQNGKVSIVSTANVIKKAQVYLKKIKSL
ncbi:MAG: amidohydrolase [Mycoplasmataceae bacterium]|nr:amidohydrolase [Mycoplasmataceae bacterium]